MDKQETYKQGLYNISPLDGREVLYTSGLGQYLSEGALHRYRAEIIISLFVALSREKLPGFPEISPEKKALLSVMTEPARFNAFEVARYDHFGKHDMPPLEHDVKAVEMYLREQFQVLGLGHLKEKLYFPPTSEDINNLAWNCTIRDSTNGEWLPKLLANCQKLQSLALRHAHDPVLGRTHGMPASPTTFGKRFAYFLDKTMNALQRLQTLRLSGKFSGPVGNHNAMTVVLPGFDMENFSKTFVESYGFRYEEIEHQRNSHIEIVRVLQEINLVNIVFADLCEHIRHSVMMELMYIEAPSGTVGSSVMPHKINPWFFEVGQRYFKKSIDLISEAGMGLVPSTFERDLTDHPMERSYGEMIGYSLVGLSYVCDGLDVVRVNTEKALKELAEHPEVLTEAVQIAGRLFDSPNVYMAIKEASRGKNISIEELHGIIDDHIPDEKMREALKALQPYEYVGKAPELAIRTANRFKELEPSFMAGLLHPVKIKAVLFDFDQTLHFGDKGELYARLTAISAALGSGFSEEEIKEFGNRSDYREMKTLMVNAHNKKHTDKHITEETFQNENDKVTGVFDHLLYLEPQARELLSLLKENKWKLGLVSTRGAQSLKRILKGYGIVDYFDVIISRDDTTKRKPSPEPLILALHSLGIKGKEAVYIGDKLEDDVPPALALGMKSILVSSVRSEKLDDPVPTFQCSTLLQVQRYLLRYM